jgi:hypothetical protein
LSSVELLSAAYGYLRSLQLTGDVARNDCGRALPSGPHTLDKT